METTRSACPRKEQEVLEVKAPTILVRFPSYGELSIETGPLAGDHSPGKMNEATC